MANNPVLDFCGFRFSREQIDAAVASIPMIDPSGATTSAIESLGNALISDTSDEALRYFSEKVCRWGGSQGARVWAKLKRNPDLPARLRGWFSEVLEAKTYESAIEPGIAIRGLAVSFASKHLRMLDPKRFAVLDSVLSEKLGFALNPKGYALFMRNLCELKQRIGFEQSIATLEYGIYELVR